MHCYFFIFSEHTVACFVPIFLLLLIYARFSVGKNVRRCQSKVTACVKYCNKHKNFPITVHQLSPLVYVILLEMSLTQQCATVTEFAETGQDCVVMKLTSFNTVSRLLGLLFGIRRVFIIQDSRNNPCLHLRLEPEEKRVVSWTSDTVDNENMGRQKSKCTNEFLFFIFMNNYCSQSLSRQFYIDVNANR